MHCCHNPARSQAQAGFGDGAFPPVFWGWELAPELGSGRVQGRGCTALREATKLLQVLGGSVEGTVFASSGGQHLSSLSEVATATMGVKRLCFSLATVPFLAGLKNLGTASLQDTEAAELWAKGHGCSPTLQTLTPCLSIFLILRAFTFLFCLQNNFQPWPLPFQWPPPF